MFLRGVPTHEYRYEADQSGQNPRTTQHTPHSSLSHDHRVLERADNGVIPIHADAAQVKNGGCGKVHVQRVPHVAHEPAEQPFTARQFGRGVERHRAHSHQEIRGCEAHHVAVGHHSQSSVPPHAGDHESIAQHRCRDYASHHDAFDHHHEHVHVFRQILDRGVLHWNRGDVVRGGARRGARVAGRRRGGIHSAGQTRRHRCHYVQHGDEPLMLRSSNFTRSWLCDAPDRLRSSPSHFLLLSFE